MELEEEPQLSYRQIRLLQWMTDLEDRGSMWPDFDRVATGSGIGRDECDKLLVELADLELIQVHPHVDEGTRYAITTSGRAALYADG